MRKGTTYTIVLLRLGIPSTEFRPNQLFAISLPFALIEGEKPGPIL